MCGIAGFVNFDEQRKGREILDRMCRVITHRGPDDQGLMIEGPAAFGMRRLSIIDLAGGHQPMSGCHDAITIVFNGEIYNYRELQRDLLARGHVFKTNSDTEVILHLYEEFGDRLVTKLRGMYGFALWDTVHRRLLVGRDRLGIKPLYFHQVGQRLLFASEIKSLLADPSGLLPVPVHAALARLCGSDWRGRRLARVLSLAAHAAPLDPSERSGFRQRGS